MSLGGPILPKSGLNDSGDTRGVISIDSNALLTYSNKLCQQEPMLLHSFRAGWRVQSQQAYINHPL